MGAGPKARNMNRLLGRRSRAYWVVALLECNWRKQSETASLAGASGVMLELEHPQRPQKNNRHENHEERG